MGFYYVLLVLNSFGVGSEVRKFEKSCLWYLGSFFSVMSALFMVVCCSVGLVSGVRGGVPFPMRAAPLVALRWEKH